MRDSRFAFKEFNQILLRKKSEAKEIKQEHQQERDWIIKQRKIAESMSFKNLKAKDGFKPTKLHPMFLDKEEKNLAVGDPYVCGRDKLRSMMPNRSFAKGLPKWNLQKSCDGDLFQTSVRQEADSYDMNYLKYMTT